MSKKLVKGKQNKGITIVALILIFIVLLIIAGIIATVLTGDNGIISKSIKAKDAYNETNIKERVQLYLTNSYNEKGKIDKDVLKENLKKNLGVNPEDIEEDENGVWTFHVGDVEVTLNTK